jgi:hypothetical protein
MATPAAPSAAIESTISDAKAALLGSDAKDKAMGRTEEVDAFAWHPQIYELAGVRPPRRGEELSGFDAEKIYKVQLEIDLKKFDSKYGRYKDRVIDFESKRMEQSATYAALASKPMLGENARMNPVGYVTSELSWRATTKLNREIYGDHLTKAPIIAKKRHQEWLTGKPKGPSQAYVTDKAQRKLDNELWEDIRFGRFEKTRVEEREESIARHKAREQKLKDEKEALKKKKSQDQSALNAKALKAQTRKLISLNKFGDLRKLPSDLQLFQSRRNWNAGHQNDWDLEGYGFPKINQPAFGSEDGTRMSNAMVTSEMDKFYEGVNYDHGNYIRGEKDEVITEYLNFIVDKNLKIAQDYVKQQKKIQKQNAKKIAKQKREQEMTRRRVNVHEGADIAYDVVMAKQQGALKNKDAAELGISEEELKNDAQAAKEKEEQEEQEDFDVTTVDLATTTIAGSAEPADGNDANGNNIAAIVPTTNEGGDKTNRKPHVKDTSLYNKLKKMRKMLKYCVKYTYVTARWIAKGMPASKKKVAPVADIEVPEEKKKKREWEKYTEEQIDAMDSKDRKRLRKMMREDQAQDAIDEAQKMKDAAALRAIQAQEERERKKKESGFFYQLYTTVFSAVTGEKHKSEMSAVERKKKEMEEMREKLMKEESNNDRSIELLIKFREKQRQANNVYYDLASWFVGKDLGPKGEDNTVEELIKYTRAGKYAEVIDLTEHLTDPIHPNDINGEGITAFYSCLEMVMNNQAVESDENPFEKKTCWQSITHSFRNAAAAGKLDLVLKVLEYQGGDINFVRPDKDGDGYSILHAAAENGANTFIHWLHRKGANFHILTSSIKRTPLMIAARYGHLDTLLALMEHGSMLSINQQDKNGWTALHFAAAYANELVCQCLMLCGADVSIQNKGYFVPIDEALKSGKLKNVDTIRSFKKDLHEYRKQLAFCDVKYLQGEEEKDDEFDVIMESDSEEGD